ncbi:MAG: alpha/beta fold hydrolase [Chitinophagaceae bacterium]
MNESVLKRFNVNVSGNGKQPLLFAHGLGCDQQMWRFITPAFGKDYKIVLFDNIGSGKSDPAYYDKEKYSSLQGYANDILAIADDLKLKDIIFVGHAVSAMTGLLAAIYSPGIFSKMIMIGPSACYINDKNYFGGFERKEIHELLDAMGKNFYNWAGSFAPKAMQNPDFPQLAKELEERMCHSDPAITIDFARAAFFADHRNDLPKLKMPSLIMQCSEDILAPVEVGEYMNKNMPQSTLQVMKATGHCPHLSAPAETIEIMMQFLNGGI